MVRCSKDDEIGIGGGSKVGQRKDPAWKYGVQVAVPGDGVKKGYVYLKCKFCSKVITGSVKRLKDHLGGTRKNVAPCPKVPQETKEMIEYMKNYTDLKHLNQRKFDEMVNSGAYFGSGSSSSPFEEKNSYFGGSTLSSRATRGPMDRFVVDLDENDD
ncbi:Zinc finger, BED-type [Trema orientale]|uniref:Zinc finger, BED-type n=1 Tax=Trema orientale TaxID=63057 RepID=A0A2P5E7X2_TREOI|nr:Zinc finger, BED-type [Trema orientale]